MSQSCTCQKRELFFNKTLTMFVCDVQILFPIRFVFKHVFCLWLWVPTFFLSSWIRTDWFENSLYKHLHKLAIHGKCNFRKIFVLLMLLSVCANCMHKKTTKNQVISCKWYQLHALLFAQHPCKQHSGNCKQCLRRGISLKMKLALFSRFVLTS